MACWRGGLLLLWVLSIAACQDEEPSAPLAPSSGGGSGVTIDDDDAGRSGPPPLFGVPDDDDDAGSEESTALNEECREVDATAVVDDAPPGTFYNAIMAPIDLAVTRVVATWESGCSQPTLRIAMSDGECPDGQGHELTFLLGVEEIEGGILAMGQNPLMEESGFQGLSVRYRRPSRLSPSGTWGTCAGANGSVDLLGPLRLEQDEMLQGRFYLDLTACDGSDAEPQHVRGTFEVVLQRGIEEVCPDR